MHTKTRPKLPNIYHSVSGFTLIELMMSIIIVMTIAALSLPTVAKVMIDDEYGSATEAVFEIARFAQVHSGMRGRACGMFVFSRDTAPDGKGKIVVYECPNSSCCSKESYENGTASTLQTLTFEDGFSSVRITNVSPVAFKDNGICFKPDGRILNPTNNQVVPSSIPGLGAGTVIIQLQQLSPMGSGNTTINPIGHRVEVGGNGDIFIDYGS